jgi:hypothetical protein
MRRQKNVTRYLIQGFYIEDVQKQRIDVSFIRIYLYRDTGCNTGCYTGYLLYSFLTTSNIRLYRCREVSRAASKDLYWERSIEERE